MRILTLFLLQILNGSFFAMVYSNFAIAIIIPRNPFLYDPGEFAFYMQFYSLSLTISAIFHFFIEFIVRKWAASK